MSLGHQWMQQFLRRPSLWEVRFESQFENLFDLFFSCRDYCLFCSKMHWQIFQSMGPCDCRAYAWLSIEDFEDIGLPGSEQSRTCYALFMILVHQRPYSSPLEVVCVCVCVFSEFAGVDSVDSSVFCGVSTLNLALDVIPVVECLHVQSRWKLWEESICSSDTWTENSLDRWQMPNTDHWPPAFQSLVLDREISNFTLKRKDKTIIDWR